MSNEVFKVVEMPEWKSKILNFVAAILGYRGEDVYVITVFSDEDE